MGDQFRQTHPINITFGQGELPTSKKIQQGFAQARDANRLIEKAIGDLWNQGGSSEFETQGYRNYQANLARVIGSTSVINPRVIYNVNPNYNDDISAHAGLTDFYLKYAPDGALILVGGSTALGTARASRALCQAAGDYYIDGAHVFTVTPLEAGITVQYRAEIPGDTDFAGGDIGTGVRDFTRPRYNVIPDPMTTGWGGAAVMVQITDAGAGLDYWLVDLPAMDGTAGLTTNRSSELSPAGGMLITTRYELPAVLGAMGPTEQIPTGFLYLWDTTTQSIVSGLTFTRQSAIQLHASPKQYLAEGNTRYALITVGLPLAVAVDNLRGLFHQHRHRRTYDAGAGEFWADGAEIDHGDLSGLSELSFSASNPFSPIGTLTPNLPQSRIKGDYHNGYLHRMGSRQGTEGSAGFSRDNYDGAMFGPLLLAAITIDPAAPPAPYWLHLNADSHGIMFGSNSGPYVYYDNALDKLRFDNKGMHIQSGDLDVNNGDANVSNGNINTGGNFQYTSNETGRLVVGPDEFEYYTYDSNSTFFYGVDFLNAYDRITAGATAANQAARATVHLPHGAIITGVKYLIYVHPGVGPAKNQKIGMYRAVCNGTTPGDPVTSQIMEETFATIKGTSINDPSWITPTGGLLNTTVDNNTYRYYLAVLADTLSAGANFLLYQAQITYTYTIVRNH